MMTKLPSVLGSQRGKLFYALALNGLVQAFAAIATSLLISKYLKEATHFLSIEFLSILMGLSVLVLFLRTLERAQAEEIGQSYVMSCRSRFFQALTSAPLHGGVTGRKGIMMTRLITDLTSMKNWVGFGLAKLTVAFFSIGGALIALYISSSLLALAALYSIIIVLCLGLFASFILRLKIRQARRFRGRLAANMGEIAAARGLSLHFNRMQRDRKKLLRYSRDMSDALVKRGLWSGFIRALPELSMPTTLALIIIISLQHNLEPHFEVSNLVTGFFMIGLMILPMRDVMLSIEFYLSYKEGKFRILNALKRHHSIYVEGASLTDNVLGPAPLDLRNIELTMCKVPVSASVKAGELVLLTSSHALLKDELFYKIAGLSSLEQLNGINMEYIAIDGFKRCNMSSQHWHKRVKLLSPELPVIKGSIRKNVLFGVNKLSSEKLKDILELCGINSCDPECSEKGHQTRLHENAKNVSESLRARISLARAIATEPGLLLVNDPIFFIDHSAKQALLRVIDHMKMTIIMSNIKGFCDNRHKQVWNLDENGLVIEEGGDNKAGHSKKLRLITSEN